MFFCKKAIKRDVNYNKKFKKRVRLKDSYNDDALPQWAIPTSLFSTETQQKKQKLFKQHTAVATNEAEG